MSVAVLGLLLLLMSVAPLAQAETRSIPLGPERNSLTLVSQQRDALVYQVEVGELAALDVTTPEGLFTRLLIPGFHSSHREGEPELAMMNRLIEIPYGATARVEVRAVDSQSISLEEVGVIAPLFPAQPSMPKSADPATWPFVRKADSYNASRVAAPALAEVIDIRQLRAAHVGRLEISPVEYYPLEKRVVVHRKMEVRVLFEGADHAAGDALKARTASPFFDVVYGQLEGYRDIHDNYPDRVRDVVTWVVVTPPDFASQIEPLLEWKKQRGFHTIMGVLGDPEVGTTTASIQTWIRNLYENGSPELPAPSFVLFVGDTAQMPTFTLSGDPTDRPYCAVDGDLMPDIYYGRFSATTPAEVAGIVDKTLMYDRFEMPDPSYLEKVVMIGGMDSSHGQRWANGQINYGTSNYFNETHGIYSYTHLYPQSGSQDAQIVQEVSQGVAYVNYTAHGSETSWSDPTFTQSDVRNLQNNGEYCLAVGNCCLAARYSYGECFAETWLRVANKGAIGYIGGSNSTYWDEDYYWGVGYCSQIVEHPTYEGSEQGAYDGIFHDHGENMDRWYVTNDAIIFCGNLAVTESGSSLTTYYWNIYNLMGDPSISAYLGMPDPNPVTHPATVFTSALTIPVTAVPGSYCGLTKDGELIGAGTVGAGGSLDLEIWAAPLTPGTAHLIVMAQNREPYRADINVIIPATITMDPEVITANVETEVRIGVFESDGITPKVGVEIWADGLDYTTPLSWTGADGYCWLTINYPFGPSIDIVGHEPGAEYELFRQPLEVEAQSMFATWIHVTSAGMSDTLALNLPALMHANVLESGHTLWALQDGEVLGQTTEHDLDITAQRLGRVEGIVAISGYDLYRRSFPVVEAFGTLSGHVDADGQPGAGAVIRGLDADMNQVFETTANGSGDYAVTGELVCAEYTITCDLFGYLHWEQPFFINHGANQLSIDLDAAPAGILSGVIREAGTGTPLAGTIKVYRTDSGALYTETTSGLDGNYSTSPLPYFTYNVVARAEGHRPVTIAVTVDEPLETQDFTLESSPGEILLIDDSAGTLLVEDKIDPLTGLVIERGYQREEQKGAADIQADLEDLGFNVTRETMSSDPSTWEAYDLIVVSSGANTTTLSNSGFRTNLRNWHTAGGRLLVEGGETGYDWYSDSNFGPTVLHISDWDHDQSGNVTVTVPSHPVVSYPNVITGPITVGYSGYGDQDANDPATGAVKVCSWTSYPENSSIIAWDASPTTPLSGDFVFLCYNHSAMATPARAQILENAVAWLLDSNITAAPEEEKLPGSFALRGNSPNPTRSSSTIAFDLPSASKVDLGVFDVHGRRVATLVHGLVQAGRHEAVWSGRDALDQEVASGVYFYRLRAGETLLTRKALLVR